MKLYKIASYYTIETVLKGHPDKVCDQICDAILDAYIRKDKNANVTVECMGSNDSLIIGGEICSNICINVENIAREIYRDIGYSDNLKILNILHQESNQTNSPLKKNLAGDQGIMYGYACKNEPNYLPYGILLINEIAKAIDEIRNTNDLILPDGKVQLTIRDKKIETIVICVQHSKEVEIAPLKAYVIKKLQDKFPILDNVERIFFNYNSNFIQGGFAIDAGLSGRKIIADTYCGLIPHGGGSFSGKDPHRLDRSATYMARFIAKNLVANGFCEECLISLAYVFGYEKPVMISVQCDEPLKEKEILKYILKNFDFSPDGIINLLNLYEVSYLSTAKYGHFTDLNYPWEKCIRL